MVARRGIHSGEPDALGREQELDLIEALRGTYPDEMGLDGEMWSRHALIALVERRYGIRLSSEVVGRYLTAWGLGPREPTERACGLCVDAVARWVERDYPAILRSAQDHDAELCWIGRTRLHGVVPAADVISSMSVQGRTRFLITTPGIDPPLPREFLLRLSGTEGRPVHVVIDGSWSRSEWPRRLPPRIVLHPLPSCERVAVAARSS